LQTESSGHFPTATRRCLLHGRDIR
jgi:hypothetical protein